MEEGAKNVWKTGNKLWYLCIGLLIVIALLLALIQKEDVETEPVQEKEETVQIEKMPDVDTVGMIEDETVYDADDPDSIVYFYVTVQRGDEGTDTDHSFAEVNSVVRFINDSHVANDVFARAIVQVGDETGPLPGMLGYNVEKSNATIRVRGNSSTVKAQKSYKLSLDEEAGLWRGQSNIALNKHAFDTTRMKNKLYFDLLREETAVPSLRTQFVRLFIKDETTGQTKFKDYGLYTQAEVPTKKYLANHGLDRDGYLYKAIGFNFEMKDGLVNFDDPTFDEKKFSTILDCKGRQDNQKLIDLIQIINDRSVDINTIVGQYIDRENYITWLAYNILLANIDTTVQNFYLYSPVNSDKWFFIPWDSDNMLHVREDAMEDQTKNYGNWEHGISNYWGVILHQRFLKNEKNREELAAKIDELHERINRETVDALVAEYDEVIRPYVEAMPDIYHLGHTMEERADLLSGLGEEVEQAYQQFYNSLEELMPFFLYVPEQKGDSVYFSWSEAYDFDNAAIQYHLLVARTPDFANPLIDEDGLVQPEYTASKLPKGKIYFKVTAHTDDGKTAQAMNKIVVNDVYYPGVDQAEVQ